MQYKYYKLKIIKHLIGTRVEMCIQLLYLFQVQIYYIIRSLLLGLLAAWVASCVGLPEKRPCFG
jgi:hypothetical protein